MSALLPDRKLLVQKHVQLQLELFLNFVALIFVIPLDNNYRILGHAMCLFVDLLSIRVIDI